MHVVNSSAIVVGLQLNSVTDASPTVRSDAVDSASIRHKLREGMIHIKPAFYKLIHGVLDNSTSMANLAEFNLKQICQMQTRLAAIIAASVIAVDVQGGPIT